MNSITMKMQADQLIRMALQEDITSEDVSTNAVMPTEVKGTVDLIAKEDGIIAGLDVYAEEPAKNEALLNHPNVSCTPHIGAATKEAQKRIGMEIVSIIDNL